VSSDEQMRQTQQMEEFLTSGLDGVEE